MAEIDIEKKSGNGKTWLWIIFAIIIAGLLYWWFAGNEDEALDNTEVEEIEDETVMKGDGRTAFWEKEQLKA